MKTYQSYMVASLLAIGALSPDPAPPPAGECSRCGAALDSVDRLSGQIQCRSCRITVTALHGATISVDYSHAARILREPSSTVGHAVVEPTPTRPIDMLCLTCGAEPGSPCDRRKMGRRWIFHRARVDAAGGAR